jgi:hypothetical protein
MVVRIDPCLKHGGRAFVASLSLLVACGDSTGGTGDTGTDPTNVTTDPSSPSNPTTDPSNPSTDPTTGAPTTGGSNSNSNSDSSSGPDPDTTSPGETSTGETTADDSSSGDTSTGDIKFDVGGVETDTDDSTTGLVGLGSCRPSEIYGAAGGFPKFSDPNYANFLEKGVAIVTTNAQEPPFNHVLHIVDISGPVPPPNMNYAAPKYRHPSWTQQNIGKVFGLTLDSDGNIYVAATTVYGANPNPGKIKRIDGVTGAITDFAILPNNGPAFGNLNYDCVSETIYVSSHEDGRIYQLDMAGAIVSTYKHATKDVTLGPANDPGEPNGQFTPLGDERVWAVQSHAGRLYYSIWREDTGRKSPGSNEIWSVGYVDDGGVPDAATAKLEFLAPAYLGQDYSNPVADISFAATGWMLISQRTMYLDNGTTAHQSTTYEFQFNNGAWENKGTTFIIGELPGSAAGGVDHDFAENGYVWMTGDALDFYTPAVVYGLQGTPHAGGDITVSTLIDMDDELQDQDKTEQGDVEVPIPGDADPVPPPQ